MPPFEYRGYQNPYVASMSALLQQPGQIEAQRAMAVANAQGQAAQTSGQAWGNAAQNIGNAASQAIQQATDPKRQFEAMQLARAKQMQAGEGVIDSAMKGTVPNGPQPEGEGPAAPQHPYLDSEGLADPKKISDLLAANGLGHLAPDLLKGVEAQNSSILAYKQHQQEAGTKQTIMLGSVANTTLALMQAGMPFQDAASHASSSLVATGAADAPTVQKMIAQLSQLPPDQLTAQLTQMKAQAARLGPTKTLSDGAKEVDMFWQTVADNPKIEKPTEASLAADAATLGTDHETKTAKDSAAALSKLKPPPVRSEPEQALDAYAKSIGKARSEDLTDAERQAYVARDAKQKAAAAFGQHVAEHTYDVNHPAPTKGKSQDELEQEARGVLRSEFSSRSGGLGIEDQKVNQAIHLRALIDQYEGKAMPAQIQAELALGLARLTSPGGTVGAELEKEFNQRTAQGGVAKAVAWITGDPTLVNATPEKLREMFADSINRQGTVAQQNRQTYLNEMIAMLPTQLEKPRRDAIVASVKPNTMPAPKGSPATGTQRNGATWKDGDKGWGWYR